jgi:hypothetical protein
MTPALALCALDDNEHNIKVAPEPYFVYGVPPTPSRN